MNKIFYEKIGRRYVPVHEYDEYLMDGLPKGSHLIMCYPGGSSRRYNVDPNYAAMIAAGRVAEDAICTAMRQAIEIRPPRKAMSDAERAAWNNLIAVWGEEARSLTNPAIRDVAEAGVRAMMAEADKLMTNPVVKKAYEKFLFICELTRENEKEVK